MQQSPATAVVKDILNFETGSPYLEATRCRDCQSVYFPPTVSCRNPECAGRSIEPARIAGSGSLYSFTVQRYRPPPLFAIEPWEPYAIGLVDMDDGVRVMGIVDVPVDDVQIGMDLKLSTRVLGSEGDETVVTHAFVQDAGKPA